MSGIVDFLPRNNIRPDSKRNDINNNNENNGNNDKNIKLIINIHLLKIAMVMFQLKIKLMILILLLEVRNLKNITKLTIKIAIIMKTITTLKVVVMIKTIAPPRHHPQKKLFSYLEEAW